MLSRASSGLLEKKSFGKVVMLRSYRNNENSEAIFSTVYRVTPAVKSVQLNLGDFSYAA